jgi:hypothetical protein
MVERVFVREGAGHCAWMTATSIKAGAMLGVVLRVTGLVVGL